MNKPTLCLDFDGVIHSYTSGWKGADVIPDPPVKGSIWFIVDAMDHFTVAIYSSRSGQPGGIEAMQSWLFEWARELASENPNMWPSVGWRERLVTEIQWPTQKPAAFLTIDDRAITFDGDWSKYDPKYLLDFKPWNKQ